MRKYVLMIGSFAALLFIAFLGGMQLGQMQMYDMLVFGNQTNEVLVKVNANDDFLIKRYRDDNRIGIVEATNQQSSPDVWAAMAVRLEDSLPAIQGLGSVEFEDNELTLLKVDGFSWKDIINQVLNLLRRSNVITQ